MNRNNRNILIFTAIVFINILLISTSGREISARGGYLSFLRDTITLQDSTLTISDTLNITDSTVVAPKQLTAKELKRIQRDSIKYIKDSIRLSTPRIIDSYIVPDSLIFKRIFVWNTDVYFNELKYKGLDTTFNEWYTENPILKRENDVNSTYLGTIGSAAQSYNYLMRDKQVDAPFFAPYMIYSYTPENIPNYNTKTPYTELGYWGTLFAYKDREEMNVRFLTTQNITPATNLAVFYQQFKANGILTREKTDNRTFSFTGNHLGKRWIAGAGIIRQTINREENGGIKDIWYVTDTTVEAKTIEYNLLEANNKLKRTNIFLNQSYGIPLNFFRKEKDSLDFGEGTMAYIGHSSEFSTYVKLYEDKITNDHEREFYNNNFFINPSVSKDSLYIRNFENKVFVKLQPWDNEAILSRLNGGLGYQILSLYNFNPDFYLTGNKNTVHNNLYLYAGASGNLKKYFAWDGFGQYYMSGYRQHDIKFDVNARISVFPKSSEISIKGRFNFESTTPHYFSDNFYSNHYKWSNNFDKTINTKLEGELEIPRFKFKVFVGNELIDNVIYYDTYGQIRQHDTPVNVLSAYVQKNFKLGLLHLDNQILFQTTSDKNIIPLPMLSLNLRYYIDFTVVKNAMQMQIGGHILFNTKYYAPAYNPALGVFQLQTESQTGMNPYIDAFINIQWKRACIFLKMTNVAQGWPTADYFSAYSYIRPQRAFKVGILWPFYYR